MDSAAAITTEPAVAVNAGKESMVDPFLVEALENPRHRLTILRMELDIQRFLQNPEQQQFEFQNFPTSYLRLAAHRVAQHYGLITMVQDVGLDGQGNRIVVKRSGEIRYPAVRLSEIPAKHSEIDKPDQVKIVIRPRPNKGSMNEANEIGIKRCSVRSVEERKEEYDRARARIFSSPSSPNADDFPSKDPADGKNACMSRDENEGSRSSPADSDKNVGFRNASTSRVAIFRDREKDRTDPDYDRSYERYVRSFPANQGYGMAPFNMQKIQFPFPQYDPAFPQMPRTQASLSYVPPGTPVANPFSTIGVNHTSRDGAYIQWPNATMMYAQSYEQFRHVAIQAPFCHQPLSFGYSPNH
ncbi:hypothetical protein SLE2022_133780 [Rubroshorea leprosula]